MSRDRVVRIGLLGFGTIGSSVYRLIQKEHDQILEGTGVDLQVARVLEIDRGKRPADISEGLFTGDFSEIVDDPSIDIVVEVIGGTGAAFDFLDAAMRKGKNVVTANKQLLATRGEALFTLARDERRHLRFEASVAGAIPIIKVMRESMIAAGLQTVYGIVNGTTNYILTRMYNDEGDYAEILAKAQELGYAEADPTADVGGADAAAKMAILGSIAFHSRVRLADVAYRGYPERDAGRRPLRKGSRFRGQAHRSGPTYRRPGERAGVPGARAGGPPAGRHKRLQQRGVPPRRRDRRDHADGPGSRRAAHGHGRGERHRVDRQHEGRGLPAELLLLPQNWASTRPTRSSRRSSSR